MGKNAEKLFRRSILTGLTLDEALAASQTQEFRFAVATYDNLDRLRATRPDGQLTEDELWTALLADDIFYARNGDGTLKIGMPCGLMAGPSLSECYATLDELKTFINSNPKLLADFMANAFDKDGFGKLLEMRDMVDLLVSCARVAPGAYADFVDLVGAKTFGDGRTLLEGFATSEMMTPYRASLLRKSAYAIRQGQVEEAVSIIRDNYGYDVIEPTDEEIAGARIYLSTVFPVLGLVMDGQDVKDQIEEGQLIWATVNGSLMLLNMLPGGAGRYIGKLSKDGGRMVWRQGIKLTDEIGSAIAKTAPGRYTQIAINRAKGAEFEKQVIDALSHVGGQKNTLAKTVDFGNGVKVTTIPDLWGRNVGGMLEAKNVKRLSNSPQLRAQAQIARENRQPLNLVVSTRTEKISKPLLEEIQSTGGDVYIYDPKSDTMILWELK